MNFGHGRRNNLVKLAEKISEKARAKSVIILEKDKHIKKLEEYKIQQFGTFVQDLN
jgi:hypothetical protein